MPRKQVTSRFRGTDIFSRRIVITVTRSGLLIVVFAITATAAAAQAQYMYGVITIISLICTIIALATTVEARHQLRNLRYEVQEKQVAILEHWQIPEDMPDLRDSVKAAFKDAEDDDDVQATFLRLPKPRRRPAS